MSELARWTWQLRRVLERRGWYVVKIHYASDTQSRYVKAWHPDGPKHLTRRWRISDHRGNDPQMIEILSESDLLNAIADIKKLRWR
jgi:hypothetical protein